MSSTVELIESFYKKAKQYTETSIELYKLSAIDTSADVISSLASRAILVLILSTSIVFLNIGLALLIGNVLGDYFKGFFIISLFYLLIAVLLYVFNKKLIKEPITNLMISKLMKPKLKEEKIKNVIANSKKEHDEQV